MLDNVTKESVLIYAVNSDDDFALHIARDVQRMKRTLKNTGSWMLFTSWGCIFFIDESRENDKELNLLSETEWGKKILSDAKREDCKQVHLIVQVRPKNKPSLKLVSDFIIKNPT